MGKEKQKQEPWKSELQLSYHLHYCYTVNRWPINHRHIVQSEEVWCFTVHSSISVWRIVVSDRIGRPLTWPASAPPFYWVLPSFTEFCRLFLGRIGFFFYGWRSLLWVSRNRGILLLRRSLPKKLRSLCNYFYVQFRPIQPIWKALFGFIVLESIF